jgi:hypothetical protein
MESIAYKLHGREYFFFNQKGGSKELTTPENIKLKREIYTNGGDQTKTPLSRTKPKARHT